MNTRLPPSKGFSLIELLIVIAIIGILSAAAYPSYQRYIERGYLSQVHTELVGINSAFKTQLVKNPGMSRTDIANALPKFIAAFPLAAEVDARYRFSGKPADSGTTRAYRLIAVPKAETGYTLSMWMDSLGNAYRCTDAASAERYLTETGSNGGCEPVHKKG